MLGCAKFGCAVLVVSVAVIGVGHAEEEFDRDEPTRETLTVPSFSA